MDKDLLKYGATIVTSIVVGGWAVYTYVDAREAAYSEYQDTKTKEYYSTYWNQKLDFFIKTSQSAAIMATTNSVTEFNKARAEYWQLFYGPLSLVEGKYVKEAMKTFSVCVPENPIHDVPNVNIKQLAYQLTIQLKYELGEGWKDPFSELQDVRQSISKNENGSVDEFAKLTPDEIRSIKCRKLIAEINGN